MRASEVNFGVEIECYLPSGTDLDVGGYHNGIQIRWAPDGWNAQNDGSVAAEVPSGYRPVEVVSPKLMGEDGLVEVYYMIETIQELGGIITDRCGMHVHVDATQLTPEQVESIKAAFIRYEKAFFGLSGQDCYRRWHNDYCKPSPSWNGSRYQSLNLTNYYSPTARAAREGKKTIEFRTWAATLDVATVVSAVYMAVALVVNTVNRPAQPTDRIPVIKEAMQAFIETHLKSRRNRIVEDEIVADIVSHMRKQARKARTR